MESLVMLYILKAFGLSASLVLVLSQASFAQSATDSIVTKKELIKGIYIAVNPELSLQYEGGQRRDEGYQFNAIRVDRRTWSIRRDGVTAIIRLVSAPGTRIKSQRSPEARDELIRAQLDYTINLYKQKSSVDVLEHSNIANGDIRGFIVTFSAKGGSLILGTRESMLMGSYACVSEGILDKPTIAAFRSKGEMIYATIVSSDCNTSAHKEIVSTIRSITSLAE
jgi:hypothetical protein